MQINQFLKRNSGSGITRLACIFGLLLIHPAAHGVEISLDFNTLPSSQGWTFTQSGQPALEAEVFSVSGGVLRQNTIGIGGGTPGTTGYRLYDAIDPWRPFSISMRARVLEEERFPPSNRPFGFSFGAFTGSEEVAVGFSLSSLQTIDGLNYGRDPIPLDTTQFHDYLLEIKPGVGYDLFVDSVLVTSGETFGIVFPNALGLGDGTGGANARAEVTSFVFSQVPEPSEIALILMGIAAFSVSQRAKAHGFRSRK